jgi:hypothetical protein
MSSAYISGIEVIKLNTYYRFSRDAGSYSSGKNGADLTETKGSPQWLRPLYTFSSGTAALSERLIRTSSCMAKIDDIALYRFR